MRKRVAAAVITLLLFCAIFPFASYNLHLPQVRRLFLLGALLAGEVFIARELRQHFVWKSQGCK